MTSQEIPLGPPQVNISIEKSSEHLLKNYIGHQNYQSLLDGASHQTGGDLDLVARQVTAEKDRAESKSSDDADEDSIEDVCQR
jgi:hypothetical protein